MVAFSTILLAVDTVWFASPCESVAPARRLSFVLRIGRYALFPLLVSGCVSTVKPTPLPVPQQAPTSESVAQTSPGRLGNPETTGLGTKPDQKGITGGEKEAGSSLLPNGAPRLPWVNPARCHPVCSFDPGPNLVRINDRAEPDEKGRHRVLRDVREPLEALLVESRAQGHALKVESAYRSYEDQARVFATIKEIGRAARPGHSEHQLGSVIDLRIPTGAAIAWLSNHAAEFGFVQSYPAQKQRLTGYRPEPWHIRYVGKDLAKKVHDEKLTLEELFRAHPDISESGSCGDCPQPASRMPCGDVTQAGRCDNTVLSFCYDGSLASVDCASSGQTCGPVLDSLVSDCLPRTDLPKSADSQAIPK